MQQGHKPRAALHNSHDVLKRPLRRFREVGTKQDVPPQVPARRDAAERSVATRTVVNMISLLTLMIVLYLAN
jgi:hypothetical protein